MKLGRPITNYKGACANLWRKIVKFGNNCEMCGATWKPLEAHHLIRKSGKGIKYSVEPKNGIRLCTGESGCHQSGRSSAHPSLVKFNNDGVAIAEFYNRLKEKCPKKYVWLIWHKDDKVFEKLDYEKEYGKLKHLYNFLCRHGEAKARQQGLIL